VNGSQLDEITLSLRQLQLLDDLRWRRFALGRSGLSRRVAKKLALLDDEIARREHE
jgi:hypothetical protein